MKPLFNSNVENSIEGELKLNETPLKQVIKNGSPDNSGKKKFRGLSAKPSGRNMMNPKQIISYKKTSENESQISND
jgi:hypothetical protein